MVGSNPGPWDGRGSTKREGSAPLITGAPVPLGGGPARACRRVDMQCQCAASPLHSTSSHVGIARITSAAIL